MASRPLFSLCCPVATAADATAADAGSARWYVGAGVSDEGTGTAVGTYPHTFRKASADGKMVVYLGRRDLVDHVTHIDPIDGVVMADPSLYEGSQRLFAAVAATFRYGREEDEVMGLTFCKELTLALVQVAPPPPDAPEPDTPLTPLQEALTQRHGHTAHPFFVQLPSNAPASVTLYTAAKDQGRPCGVYYELRVFTATSADQGIAANNRSSVRLAIRKVQCGMSPVHQAAPTTSLTKEFVLSPGKLTLFAALDKQCYHYGETIRVNVSITNTASRSIRKLKVSVVQVTDICMFASGRYKTTIIAADTSNGFPFASQTSFSRQFGLTPVLSKCQEQRGIVLEGQIRDIPAALACSTIFADSKERDIFGFIISYFVKVKLSLSTLGGDIVVQLPFELLRPKPTEDEGSCTAAKSSSSPT